VADGDSGLLILDVDEATAPKEVRQLMLSRRAISVVADAEYAYVGTEPGETYAVRLSDLQLDSGSYTVPPVNRLAFDEFTTAPHRLCALYTDRIVVYDLSDPMSPARVDERFISGTAGDLSLVEKRMLVAERDGGARSYYLVGDSIWTSPMTVSNELTKGAQLTAGGFAFLAHGPGGVTLWGVPTGSPLHFTCRTTTSGSAQDVAAGYLVDYVYIADSSGLTVVQVDLDRPRMPELGHYQFDGLTRRAALSADHVYIASGAGGVHIVERQR
jgi:hypothetical protein